MDFTTVVIRACSLNDPEVTKVEDTQALTDDEKSAVATAVKDANPDADISNVSVADDGTEIGRAHV